MSLDNRELVLMKDIMKLYNTVLFLVFILFNSAQIYSQDTILITGFYTVVENDSCLNSSNFINITDGETKYCINKIPVVTNDNFVSVKIVSDSSREGIYNTVRIKLDSITAKGFKETTSKLVGKKLALIINNKIITAPVLRDPIESGEIAIFCDEETINIIKKEFGIK